MAEHFMGQENPRISSGEKERESGLTSCGNERDSAEVFIAVEQEVGDDDPTSAEKHLVWHWGKMTHDPSKTYCDIIP